MLLDRAGGGVALALGRMSDEGPLVTVAPGLTNSGLGTATLDTDGEDIEK